MGSYLVAAALFILVAQVAQPSAHGPPRRAGRRNRHGAGRRRHADHVPRRLAMGARRHRARLADRCADGHLDADDRRAAADGAVARVRRAGRRARRHRPLLRATAQRHDRPLHDGHPGDRSAARQPDVHRQPRRVRQAAGIDSQLDQRPAESEPDQLRAARRGDLVRHVADVLSGRTSSCSCC